MLSTSALLRQRSLIAGAQTSGSLCWTREGEDEPHASIGYEANLMDPEYALRGPHYQCRGEPVDYRVRLVTKTPNYGGLRWWFL